MSRQQRRRERRSDASPRHAPIIVDERPWYFRYGYHVGVWTGAAFGVIWFALNQDIVGLIIGIVLGQVAGVVLSRQGRQSN